MATEKRDWGKETVSTPTSVEEFIAEVDTDPELLLDDLKFVERDLSEVDADKMEIEYQGQRRTVTGVVKIMRLEGHDESAELLEDLIKVGQEAKKLVEAVHKKATGSHARPQLRKHP